MRKKLTLQASFSTVKRHGGWALSLLALLVVLACTACVWLRVGDWELSLGGEASSPGEVGYEVNGRLLSVDVEVGETAEEIGPRLAALMKTEGLVVECELYNGEYYYFILREVQQPASRGHVLGIVRGVCGPLQDDRMLIEATVTWFYRVLNANNQVGVSARTTGEFREEALDVMASMAASGEQISIESVDDLTIDCYQATICLHIIRAVDTEQQPVDTCLTLTRPSPCEKWLVSGGSIR